MLRVPRLTRLFVRLPRFQVNDEPAKARGAYPSSARVFVSAVGLDEKYVGKMTEHLVYVWGV